MALEQFIDRSFRPSTLAVIDQANTIIAEYEAQGFTLTLRQIYYQFVARGLRENTVQSYKSLGSIINDGRLAGLIDWDSIEDRMRNLKEQFGWDSPAQVISTYGEAYREDPWLTQSSYVEVWIEKDALGSVAQRACDQWRVPLMACRGYMSQSEIYMAGKRILNKFQDRKSVVIFHLGDHDPSGIDMTRDNADRLSMFAGRSVEVQRLALNIDQVRTYNPPPNPAKESDSRATGYMEKFGDESWELDALDPRVIDQLIQTAVRARIDIDAWDEAMADEKANRDRMAAVAIRWDDVVEFVENDEE